MIKCLLFLPCLVALLAACLSWRWCFILFHPGDLAADFLPFLGEESNEMVLSSFPIFIFDHFLYHPSPVPMISISLFMLSSLQYCIEMVYFFEGSFVFSLGNNFSINSYCFFPFSIPGHLWHCWHACLSLFRFLIIAVCCLSPVA